MKISVTIITLNESKNLSKCIESVKSIADEIIVLDSFSTDNTKEIAEQYGASVFENKFDGHVQQKNRAVSLAKHELIFSLDADEWISKELANEIISIKNSSEIADGYIIKRKNIFLDKRIYRGVWLREYKIRLFKASKAKWAGLNPHDLIEMNEGSKVKKLNGGLLHHPYKSINELANQMNKFSEIAAKAYFEKGIKSNTWKIFLKPIWRFLLSYIFNLGFLDGTRGLILSSSFSYYTFLKYTKLWRLQKEHDN
ncbi:MAG: glycosyltransferase family 2 protein [Bacteroidota bacterium]